MWSVRFAGLHFVSVSLARVLRVVRECLCFNSISVKHRWPWHMGIYRLVYTQLFLGFPLWYLIALIDSESACFWIAFFKWSIVYFIFFRHRHLAIPYLTVQTQLAGCRGFAYQLYSECFNFVHSQHIFDGFLYFTLCPWPCAAYARFLGYVFPQQCVRCDLH